MKSKKLHEQRGQGIVEYILITAMVALAAIAIFKTFREDVRTAYQTAGQTLVQGVSEGLSSDVKSGE